MRAVAGHPGRAWAARVRTASGLAWAAVAALSLVVFVAGIPYQFRASAETRGGADAALAGLPRGARSFLEGWVFTGAYPYLSLGIEAALVISMALVAVFLYWRLPDDRLAWLASVTLLSYASVWTAFGEVLAFEWAPWWVLAGTQEAVGLTSSIVLFFVFPDGRFVPAWARYVAAAWILWSLYWSFGPLLVPVLFPPSMEGTFWFLSAIPALLFNLVAILVQAYRYRRVSSEEERRRTRWVILSFAVGTAAYFAVTLGRVALGALGYGRAAEFLLFSVGTHLVQVSLLFIPVCVLLAVVRHRLFGIEVVVNHALVYAALTLCVVGIYVLVVGYLGNLFRVGDNLFVSLLATGIVAVIFAPLRDRLQRAANRLMYGMRDEPYAVLSRLGQRLEGTLAPGAVLPAIVETVAGALKAPHAAISLKLEDRFETAAEHGTPTGAPLVLPLVYNSETVGRLEVSPRAKGEPYAPSDRRLLEDLARQAGVAAHAVRLTADLQRSRERLVAAREEERRRLRRDLHDGVGPRLAALTLKIETTRNRLSHDPAADELLSDLAGRAHEAVADVRRSVHALRPPVLDELGLIPALRETAAQYGANDLTVSVRTPDALPPLPAAVEVAAYRIAQEAITNVARHAGARHCAVRLELDPRGGVLRLEVEDDGRGMGAGRGVGLHSMRERAEELGGTLVVGPAPEGGTRVRAELPCATGGGA